MARWLRVLNVHLPQVLPPLLHQDNVRYWDDHQTSGEAGSEVGAHSHRSVDLLWDSFKGLLVAGECPKVVADDGAEAWVDVEDRLLERERVAVHGALPLARSQTAEEKEPMLLLCRHPHCLFGKTHCLDLVFCTGVWPGLTAGGAVLVVKAAVAQLDAWLVSWEGWAGSRLEHVSPLHLHLP